MQHGCTVNAIAQPLQSSDTEYSQGLYNAVYVHVRTVVQVTTRPRCVPRVHTCALVILFKRAPVQLVARVGPGTLKYYKSHTQYTHLQSHNSK
jgi:hypothetical protein